MFGLIWFRGFVHGQVWNPLRENWMYLYQMHNLCVPLYVVSRSQDYNFYNKTLSYVSNFHIKLIL